MPPDKKPVRAAAAAAGFKQEMNDDDDDVVILDDGFPSSDSAQRKRRFDDDDDDDDDDGEAELDDGFAYDPREHDAADHDQQDEDEDMRKAMELSLQDVPAPASQDQEPSSIEKLVFSCLKKLASDIATALNTTATTYLSSEHMQLIAQQRPDSLPLLEALIGESRSQKFGAAILSVVSSALRGDVYSCPDLSHLEPAASTAAAAAAAAPIVPIARPVVKFTPPADAPAPSIFSKSSRLSLSAQKARQAVKSEKHGDDDAVPAQPLHQSAKPEPEDDDFV